MNLINPNNSDHQISSLTHRHLRIRVCDRVEAGGRLGTVQPDGEEDLLVLLHGGEDLGVQVAGSLQSGNMSYLQYKLK